ncbi:uncharacterized protein Triagg1_1001 [Trichoderma aggressivum f. europaeum]|uniref:Uncharacterized protein n=1 Tax=Trichoderma aggressivum f. europaeum TaxID=173218 RepID=A0AAE1IL72_9HYPO|nr:hypothetical protein Triagg1_1001 [Trichoderma aggressivum f. europaeum]
MAASGRVGTGPGRGCYGWTLEQAPSSARRGGVVTSALYLYGYLYVCEYLYCAAEQHLHSRRRTPGQGSDRASTGPQAGGGQHEEVPGARGSGSEVRVLCALHRAQPTLQHEGPRLAEASPALFRRWPAVEFSPGDRPAALHPCYWAIGLTDDSQRPLQGRTDFNGHFWTMLGRHYGTSSGTCTYLGPDDKKAGQGTAVLRQAKELPA